MPVSKDAGIFVFGMFFAAFTGKATQHWRTPCTTVAAGKTKACSLLGSKTFVERLLLRFCAESERGVDFGQSPFGCVPNACRAVARASFARYKCRISRATGGDFDRIAAHSNGLVVSAAL
jgi:hypothetical protein